MQPIISAICAGNCCIVKPSEMSPATANFIALLFSKIMNIPEITIVLGGVEETTLLLEQRFDLIFYTGSSVVGKIVM